MPSPSARSISIEQWPFVERRLVAGGHAVDEHGHAVDDDREPVRVERREAAVELRRAGGGGDAAPVGVVAVERRLHERRRRDALGDRARLAVARRAADGDLGEHGRAFAVGDDLLRELAAHRAQAERELLVGRRRALDAARAVREQQDRVVRRALAVDGDGVEARVDRRAQELDRLAGLERVVGRDDGEHRREVGVDHPGALRHPADREAGAVRDRLLRARVGRAGSPRPPSAPPSSVERDRGCGCRRATRSSGSGCADDARGEDEHLLGSRPSFAAAARRGRARVVQAALAGGRVRDAGVGDDRLRLRQLEVLARDDDRRRLHAVGREHPGAGRGDERAHEREVEAVLADAAVHGAGDEALGGGDAHTSTPASRRPAVSSRPSARFAFWIAWPAAPLPRLSSAQTTIVVPVERVRRRRRSRRASVPWTRVSSGVDALGEDAHDVAVGVRVLEQRARVVVRVRRNTSRAARAARGGGAGRSRPGSRAAARSPARAGARRRAYGETFSSTKPACELAFSSRPAPETPDFASTTTLSGLDRVGERREREQRGGRVAAGVGDELPLGREELRQAVAPRARARPNRTTRGASSGSASRCAPERSTTTASAGGSTAAARSWPRQRKTTSAPAASASSFGTNARQRPVQADVEGGGRLAGERVGAERDDLELGMAEHAVERLLAGVARGPEDGRRRHSGILCNRAADMQIGSAPGPHRPREEGRAHDEEREGEQLERALRPFAGAARRR